MGTAIPTKVVGMLVVSTLPTKVVGMQANKQIQEEMGSYIHFVERQINFMKTLEQKTLTFLGLQTLFSLVSEVDKVKDLVFCYKLQ